MRQTDTIHVFAECDACLRADPHRQNCPFTTEDHRRGIEAARRHAKRQKHLVKIDVGKIEIINHQDP